MNPIIEFFKGLWEKLYNFFTDPRFITTIFVLLLIYLLLALFTVISKWKMYKKAGYPGWTCLIPHVDDFVLIRVAGLSGWYFPITFIPSLDPYTFLILNILVARAFKKSGWFGVGLYILPMIFYPILLFSIDNYVYPKLSARAKIKELISKNQHIGG